ncbi:ubiquitin fusion degradation protein UFD1, putative (UFD1) [Plasmodium ovale curtisi]|uniref:Ubiquitin fusion degradation protein UFD1, putative (UFD1) n=1 Tax=Plasmodium ovale curtisi TaxID=864141 RepID=A0A1A8W755_PLAOA|nr:ubiquitin fusion degradation protein UFD1, putative (UFD1) [Plasmodium ovale curtisi]
MWSFTNFNNFLGRDFLNISEPFTEEYTCYPVSFIGKDDMENGNKSRTNAREESCTLFCISPLYIVILPQTALNALARRHISWPMLFEVSNPYTEKRTHSGVLEFISDEGTCHMPYWMMQQLCLKEGDVVRVTSVSLPKGTFVKLKPCSKDFMELSNHRAVLETALRNYATLTIGDNIVIHHLGKTYEIKIVDLKPAFACTIIETDVEVEFEEPTAHTEDVQYVEEGVSIEESKFKGKGQRTDGKVCKNVKKEKTKPKVVENLEPWKDKLVGGVRTKCTEYEDLLKKGRIPGIIGKFKERKG